MRIFKKIFFIRKVISEHIKLMRRWATVRAYYDTIREGEVKPFKTVQTELRYLINSGRGIPIPGTMETYFKARLHHKGRSIDNYLFYGEWKRIIAPLLEWAADDCRVLTYKELSKEHFLKNGLPTPQSFGTLTISAEGIRVEDNEEASSLLKLLQEEKYLCIKPSNGSQGKGICFLEYIDDTFCFLNGERCEISGLAGKLTQGSIVESHIRNHSLLNEIYPHSLNTLRLITMRDTKGKIHFISGIHRFGTGGNKVDNTHGGGMAIGVNEETGCWRKWGYIDSYSSPSTIHPDSGFVFEDKPIPFFREAVQLALRAHATFDRIQAVGWDIAITSNGPVIIEGNQLFSIFGPQFCNRSFNEELNTFVLPCVQAVKSGQSPWPVSELRD